MFCYPLMFNVFFLLNTDLLYYPYVFYVDKNNVEDWPRKGNPDQYSD